MNYTGMPQTTTDQGSMRPLSATLHAANRPKAVKWTGGVFDPVLPTQATPTGTRRGMGADGNFSVRYSGENGMPLFSRGEQPAEGEQRSRATAFEKKPSGERGVGFDTPAPTHEGPMLTRPDAGADGNKDILDLNGAPPLFSRSPADLARGAGAAIKAMTVTDVKNKLVDYRGPALQSLRKAPDQGRRVLAPKTQRGKDMNWCRYVSQPPAR